MRFRVIRWAGTTVPTQHTLHELMERDGLHPHAWSNGPFETYPPHSHPYHKIIYVAEGEITFGLPGEDRKAELKAGDRLDLPAGTVHEAIVGADGVVCLEAHSL